LGDKGVDVVIQEYTEANKDKYLLRLVNKLINSKEIRAKMLDICPFTDALDEVISQKEPKIICMSSNKFYSTTDFIKTSCCSRNPLDS
jgi:hypothetical protein